MVPGYPLTKLTWGTIPPQHGVVDESRISCIEACTSKAGHRHQLSRLHSELWSQLGWINGQGRALMIPELRHTSSNCIWRCSWHDQSGQCNQFLTKSGWVVISLYHYSTKLQGANYFVTWHIPHLTDDAISTRYKVIQSKPLIEILRQNNEVSSK